MKIIDSLKKYIPFYKFENIVTKTLIGDPGAIPLPNPTKSSDYNTGAIVNELEYMNKFIDDMINQLSINDAEKLYGLLEDISNIYNIAILTNETDAEYIDKLKLFIMGMKGTKWDILYALDKYLDTPAEILESPRDGFFYDVSFYDYFHRIDAADHVVTPAIFRESSTVFYFEVYLTATSSIIMKNSAFADDAESTGYFLTNNTLYGKSFAGGIEFSSKSTLFLIDVIERFKMAGTYYTIYVL